MQDRYKDGYEEIKKVSVIVLAYNNYSSLAQCIESVAGQTYKNIEVVLADDCSRDIDIPGIKQTVSSIIGGRYELRFIFNTENMGTVRNFNNAIASSSGELIVPLAMDDTFADEDSVRHIVEHFNKSKALLGTSYSCRVSSSKMMIGPSEEEARMYPDSGRTIEKLFKYGLFFKGANTYYHRSVFELLGKFDEEYRLYEDVPFLFKYLDRGYAITLVPYVCVIYSVNEGVSAKKGGSPVLRGDRVRLFEKILESGRYKNIRKWIEYSAYRNKYPEKKLAATIKYPGLVMNKALASRAENKNWIEYVSRDELRSRIKSFNSGRQAR